MSEQGFEALVRQAAAAVSRRSSLQALGGAALAMGLAMPATTEAAKGNKAKKKFKKKCNKSKNQCRTIALANEAEELLPCCNTCLTGPFLVCVISLSA